MKKPELLSPAGTYKNMQYAFAYGADAVYAGQPRYSLRVRNNEFDVETLKKGIDYAHSLSKKFYVVCNIQAHNSKIEGFLEDIAIVIAMNPDALIMSDPGLISLVREKFSHQEIHLSVQANAVNWASVKFWYGIGISRIVLSRELSLKEIEQIKEKVPEIELEVFVHGALCMAYSGRCLLSGYINKRDANQGTCTNACRWSYKTHKAKENEVGQVVELKNRPKNLLKEDSKETKKQEPTLGVGKPTDEMFLLEEQGRPNELMPAFEDEHGTYIMNSKDLRAVELVPDLVNMGVHSLKIEGRTKSFYYVARSAQVYRKAIDVSATGEQVGEDLIKDLDSLANRGYTAGFLQRHIHSEYQNYEYGSSRSTHQRFVGEVIEEVEINGKSYLEIEAKNKFGVGDDIEIMSPKGNIKLKIEEMLDKKNNPMKTALGSGWVVKIPNPFIDLDKEDLKFGLVMRFEAWSSDGTI